MLGSYRIINWAWLIFAVIWLVTAFTSKRTVRRQSAGSRLVQVGLGIVAGLLIWGPWSAVLGREVVQRSVTSAHIALALTLVGMAFAMWARLTLGRNWSGTVTVKQDHELVRSGPYSIVRHPIYSGILLALLGTAIARGYIGAFIGMAVAAVALRLKSLTEEAFMTEQFGSQYATYKRSVKALIPFVW